MPLINSLLTPHVLPNETLLCRNKDTKISTKTYKKSRKVIKIAHHQMMNL